MAGEVIVQKTEGITDTEKRNFIVDVLGVGVNTVGELTGSDLQTAYQTALKKAEGKNMGGAVVDDLGYMRGGMTEERRGPIKYSKGGAIKGRDFKGSF